MKVFACLSLILTLQYAYAAEPVEPPALATGITLQGFVTEYNKHAKFDGEPLINGQGCKQYPIPNTNKKGFECIVTSSSFVHGVVKGDGKLQHISIDRLLESSESLHTYRRSAGYLVRAVKGGTIVGVGTVVADLLGASARANGKSQDVTAYGLNISTGRGELGWSLSAEQAKK